MPSKPTKSKSHSKPAHQSSNDQLNQSSTASQSSRQSLRLSINPAQKRRSVKKHKSSTSNSASVPKVGLIDRLRLFLSSTMNQLSNSIATINQTITSTMTRAHEFEPDVPIYLLGESFNASEPYHFIHQSASDSPIVSAVDERRSVRSHSDSGPDGSDSATLASMLQLWHSMIWLTYRTGFEPIRPSLTSDAGWGCMIRTTQMMIAAALSRIWLGRKFTLPDGDQSALPSLYLTLLSLFIDSPEAPFSLHAMLNDDQSNNETTNQSNNQATNQTPRAGEWFGPTATCHMISRCVNRLHSTEDQSLCELVFPRVYLTDDQTIYLDEIQTDSLSADATFQPLLVLVPSRLGADRVNPDYQAPLLRTFTCPSSLGLLGGKPRTSLYFAGCQGNRLLYLDPHTVNQSVESKDSLNNASIRETFHSNQVRSLPFDALDPSLALGFIMTTQTEFDRWLDDLKQMGKEFGAYALIHVRETRQKLNESADDSVLTEDEDDEFVVL